jgi:hypothetical protein
MAAEAAATGKPSCASSERASVRVETLDVRLTSGVKAGGFQMRKFVALMLLLCSLSLLAHARAKDEFTISLSLKTGERSRDSHAATTTIQLTGNNLVYEQTYSGAGANRREPVRHEFKLSGDEISRLKSLVKEQNLLGSGVLKFEPAARQFNYFELDIKITLKGIIATQELSGARNAANIKQERVYQKSIALLQELHRLINLRDKEISYDAPVS